MTEEKNILKIHDLKVPYGGIEAVKGVTLTVPEGKVVTLIGANGAGKSTTLQTVSGTDQPEDRAASLFEGRGHHRKIAGAQDCLARASCLSPRGVTFSRT